MKKSFYKILTAVCLLLVLTMTACFAQIMPPEEQLADDLTYSAGEWRSKTRSDEFTITYTDFSISVGDGYVRISATTETNIMANSVGANMIVEQWTNNGWVEYDNFYFLAYDSSSATYAHNMPVESGHYYRLHVNHRAHYWELLRTMDSYSKTVYVN